MKTTIICFRKAHWNESQRKSAVHENPVFLFIAVCGVGSGSSGHMYSTKRWTPKGRFSHIWANWPYLKPLFVWGQAYQSHSLNSTFNPDFILQQCKDLFTQNLNVFILPIFIERKSIVSQGNVTSQNPHKHLNDVFSITHATLATVRFCIQIWNPNLLRECQKFSVNSCGAK